MESQSLSLKFTCNSYFIVLLAILILLQAFWRRYDSKIQVKSQEIFPLGIDHRLHNQPYVVLSLALGAQARSMDYLPLTPFTISNWIHKGFHIILILVATHSTMLPESLQQFLRVLMKTQKITLHDIRTSKDSTIALAQFSRLFAYKIKGLDPSRLMITSDIDIMIVDVDYFLNHSNHSDVFLHNGDCRCGVSKGFLPASRFHTQRCKQFPIHSIMMNVSTWREIFEEETPNLDLDESFLLDIMGRNFGYHGERVRHGGKFWSMDQSYAACAIKNSKFHVSIGHENVKKRAHVLGRNVNVVDVHLAYFRINQHMKWLMQFSNESNLIPEYQMKYLAKTFDLKF